MLIHFTVDIELKIRNISDVVSDIEFNKYKLSDPEKVNDSLREYCIQKGPEFFQNKNDDFKQSLRIYGILSVLYSFI